MGKLGVVKAMGSDGTRTSATMDNAVGGCKYIFIDFVQHMILNMHPFMVIVADAHATATILTWALDAKQLVGEQGINWMLRCWTGHSMRL